MQNRIPVVRNVTAKETKLGKMITLFTGVGSTKRLNKIVFRSEKVLEVVAVIVTIFVIITEVAEQVR